MANESGNLADFTEEDKTLYDGRLRKSLEASCAAKPMILRKERNNGAILNNAGLERVLQSEWSSQKAISERSLSDGTRQSYNSYISRFRGWLNRHLSDGDEEVGAIDVSKITVTTYMDFINEESFYWSEGKKIGVKSFDSLNSLCSALNTLWTKVEKISIPVAITNAVKEYKAGFKRLWRHLEREGLVDSNHGKSPLNLAAYGFLLKKIVHYTGRDVRLNAQTRVYLTLLWNLMCRTDNVSSLTWSSLSLGDDCLKVNLSYTKGDPEGNKNYLRGLFANPHDPVLCPLLALSMLVFSMTPRDNKRQLILDEDVEELDSNSDSSSISSSDSEDIGNDEEDEVEEYNDEYDNSNRKSKKRKREAKKVNKKINNYNNSNNNNNKEKKKKKKTDTAGTGAYDNLLKENFLDPKIRQALTGFTLYFIYIFMFIFDTCAYIVYPLILKYNFCMCNCTYFKLITTNKIKSILFYLFYFILLN
jgi:hypothetical protein